MTELLEKVAQFCKLAVSETRQLKSELQLSKSINETLTEQLSKEAADTQNFRLAIREAADALYDTDFLTDESERYEFMKKAQTDPTYLANVLKRVCKSAEVTLIGRPAGMENKIDTRRIQNDPVYRRAFGGELGF